jgi:hypothetical protein
MNYKPNKCHCKFCNDMCRSSPCWPTPEEAKKLQEAHPDKVAYDGSYFNKGVRVWVLRPRTISEKPMSHNQGYAGQCVFFENERCALHYTGLKPLEGRLSSHGHTSAERKELRFSIGRMWHVPC